MCLMPYANNKGADQPAHPRSLISAFVVRSLDSIISLVSRSEISRFQLVSVAEQAGLNVTRSQTPEDTFSLDGAHILKHIVTSYLCCTNYSFSCPITSADHHFLS